MAVRFKNNVLNNTKSLLFLIFLIAFQFSGCKTDPPIISRYSLRIVGTNDNKFNYEEIVSLMQCDSCNDTIFLPAENSNLTLIDCYDSRKQTSLFVDDNDLITPTQLTAGSYNWETVNQKLDAKVKSIFIDSEGRQSIKNDCPDSTLLEKMFLYLTTLPSDIRVYTISNDISIDSLTFFDATYKHHYIDIALLKTAIKNDLKENHRDIVVIYNPPNKKSVNSNIPIIIKGPVRKKIKPEKSLMSDNEATRPNNILQTTSKEEDQINWKQPIRINTDNKLYFEWTDFGDNVTYDYKIVDFDSPQKILFGSVSENRLNVPSTITKKRQYVLTIFPKYNNKVKKSEDCVFTVEYDGSISQECKK